MGRTIGILASEHIAAGLVEDNHIVGQIARYPKPGSDSVDLYEMPADEIVQILSFQKAFLEAEHLLESLVNLEHLAVVIKHDHRHRYQSCLRMGRCRADGPGR